MSPDAHQPPAEDRLEKAIETLHASVLHNFEHAAEAAARLDKTLISLSAGALVFSTTLVSTFAPSKLWLPVLFGAWGCFIATLLFVIFAMRAEQKEFEKRIAEAYGAAKLLENNPVARHAAAHLEPGAHVTTTNVSRSQTVGFLNKCSLLFFVLGVLLLAAFVGYNQWNAQPSRPADKPLNAQNQSTR